MFAVDEFRLKKLWQTSFSISSERFIIRKDFSGRVEKLLPGFNE